MPPSRALIVSRRGVGVQRAAQQRLRLHHFERLLQPIQLVGHFGRQIVVFLGHLDEHRQIVGRLEHLFQRLQHGLEPLQLADDFAGAFLVAPEIGSGHAILDLRRLLPLAFVVKESPSVGESAVE